MKSFFLLACLGLSFGGHAADCDPDLPSAEADREAHAADIAAVTALNLGWNQADLDADRTWFEHNLADDFIAVTSRRGAMEDKASTLAGVGQYRLEDASSTDLVATVHGDSARVTGIFHTRGTDADGKPFVRSVRYIDTYIRRDGRWQVWSSQGTHIPDHTM
jgi:ketosteroid isomerase-like protein